MALIFVSNDYKTCIPGSPTLWDDLLDWLPGADWVGDTPFHKLAEWIEAQPDWPDLLIRNGSYFRQVRKSYPQVSLLQDIFPLGSDARMQQLAVALGSKLVVYNSAFTKAQFPELDAVPHRIIPLPVDFDLFRPMPEVEKVSDVCWIGAKSHVKGYDILVDLIQKTDFTFTLVMKDDQHPDGINLVHPRVRMFNRVPHAELPAIINSCRVGLCTSRMETQHLAGIEMGGCGLPLLTPMVGFYWNLAKGPWGLHFSDEVPASTSLGLMVKDCWDGRLVRETWHHAGLDRASCKAAWLEAVETCLKSS